MKTVERDLARTLRRVDGLPVKEIARRLAVSTSSVSHWVRDVELTTQQQEALRAMNPAYNRQLNGSRANAASHRAKRVAAQNRGRMLAQQRNPLHLAGCVLYWAEGSRHRNQIRFTNSDPEMVRLFATFLRRCFDLCDSDMRVTCNLFPDHLERQGHIEQFWLDIVGVPETSLCKSTVNTYSKYSKKKRQNKLPYGTCRLTVNRTHIVQSIYGSIQEYAGFDRPAWLE